MEDLEVETEVVTLALWFLFDIHSKKPREIFALPRLEEMFDFLEKYQFYYEKVGNAFSSRCRETKDYEDTLEFSDSTKRPFAHQIARSCAEKMLQTFRDRDAERKERDDWNPMFDR